MLKIKYIVILLGPLLLCEISFAQSYSDKPDSTYYDSWIGVWYKEVDGKIENSPTFVVTQGLYKAAFEETWMGAGGDFSKAWRAWDGRTKKWDFAWMSADGLFQIWEGKKIDGIWYMYKTFILDDGLEVLSRQAFIPKSNSTLVRTSEHSRDNGKTWQLRFKENYQKRN